MKSQNMIPNGMKTEKEKVVPREVFGEHGLGTHSYRSMPLAWGLFDKRTWQPCWNQKHWNSQPRYFKNNYGIDFLPLDNVSLAVVGSKHGWNQDCVFMPWCDSGPVTKSKKTFVLPKRLTPPILNLQVRQSRDVDSFLSDFLQSAVGHIIRTWVEPKKLTSMNTESCCQFELGHTQTT